MDKKILLRKILEYFNVKDIGDDLNTLRKQYKDLVLSLGEYDIPEDILLTDDKYLRSELINKKLTDGEQYNTIDINLDGEYKHGDKVALWEGDMSTIYADVLINPVNSNFDLNNGNSLYLNAGMRLRKKCLDLTKNQKLKPTEYLITRAYNLICDFIIHVVLPENSEDLASCYYNVLDCANNNIAKTVVLKDIGNDKKLLVEEIMKFLDKENNHIEKIIISTTDDDDFEEYIEILEQYKRTT